MPEAGAIVLGSQNPGVVALDPQGVEMLFDASGAACDCCAACAIYDGDITPIAENFDSFTFVDGPATEQQPVADEWLKLESITSLNLKFSMSSRASLILHKRIIFPAKRAGPIV